MRNYTDAERAAIAAERQAAAVLARLETIEAELFELRDVVKGTPGLRALRECVDTFHSQAWDAMSEAEKVVKARTSARKAAAHAPPCANC